jgi:hypothetical protein
MHGEHWSNKTASIFNDMEKPVINFLLNYEITFPPSSSLVLGTVLFSSITEIPGCKAGNAM